MAMVDGGIRQYNYDPNHQHKPIQSIRDYRYYKMYLVKNGSSQPNELVFGEVSWRDNIESLGIELHTSIPRNTDDRFLSIYDTAEVGDGIIFKNLDQTIFTGIIENIDIRRFSKDIVCYDFGYLLNKTAIVKQFSKIKGHVAIQNICQENGIPVGQIVPMSVDITEIYKNTAISDIFKDIIEKEEALSGRRLTMEMTEGKLNIIDVATQVLKLNHKPNANVSDFDPTLLPGQINRNMSVEDSKNHVQVVFEQTKKEKTSIRIVAEAKDDEHIKKYGARVHIESVSKEQLGEAQTIANNKLRELTGVRINTTIELLGDDNLRSGRIIELESRAFGLQGQYLVLNCEQLLRNSNRLMTLEIEGV